MADAESPHPPITVYLAAKVRDHTVKGSRPRTAWSLRLQRWPAEEVYRIIVETFTRLAQEEDEWTRQHQPAAPGAAPKE